MNKFILRRYNWAALAVCLIAIVIHVVVYPYLPDKIPYHWNFAGNVDEMGSRHIIFFFAFFPIFLYLLLFFIPRLDPKREAYIKHTKAYSIFVLVLVTFMSLITLIILLASLGYHIPIAAVVGALLGILLLFIGNYMGQIRPNFLFGIRTPWTLVSEQTWRRTHRLGGRLFAGLGMLMIIGVFFDNLYVIFGGVVCILLVSIALYIYSYRIYCKENK